jgi:hypothetical protein
MYNTLSILARSTQLKLATSHILSKKYDSLFPIFNPN